MKRWMLAGIGLLVAVLGCSTERSAPVSGRVTFDGKPLAGAHVTFQPLADGSADPGGGSYAVTGADGSYSLQLVQGPGAGAVVGKHRVEIIMRNENSDVNDQGNKRPKFAVNIPAKYNVSSELTCVVPAGGKSDANFDLKSK